VRTEWLPRARERLTELAWRIARFNVASTQDRDPTTDLSLDGEADPDSAGHTYAGYLLVTEGSAQFGSP
jgi:hypothetical protein